MKICEKRMKCMYMGKNMWQYVTIGTNVWKWAKNCENGWIWVKVGKMC